MIETMKHYLIAFCIVFSALSSSWVGAMTVVQSSNEMPCHEQMTMENHDCCDEAMNKNTCSSCENNCYCDINSFHLSFGLFINPVSSFITDKFVFVSSLSTQLSTAPILKSFQPPKIINL